MSTSTWRTPVIGRLLGRYPVKVHGPSKLLALVALAAGIVALVILAVDHLAFWPRAKVAVEGREIVAVSFTHCDAAPAPVLVTLVVFVKAATDGTDPGVIVNGAVVVRAAVRDVCLPVVGFDPAAAGDGRLLLRLQRKGVDQPAIAALGAVGFRILALDPPTSVAVLIAGAAFDD